MTAQWKLVPVEPTDEMVEAGWIDTEGVDPDDIYGSMLAAAPEPPAEVVERIRDALMSSEAWSSFFGREDAGIMARAVLAALQGGRNEGDA